MAALGDLHLDITKDFKAYEDNYKPEFLAKFPNGKIPALELKDGFKLFESTAIARYGTHSDEFLVLGNYARFIWSIFDSQ